MTDRILWQRVFFFFCSLIAVILYGCEPAVEKPISLGAVTWPGYEPLYLARDLGYLDESKVKLIEHSATTETIEAFRNDALDMAALTLDELLLLKQQGKDLIIILVTDISNGGDVILGNAEVKSMTDLKGKRVGFEATALGAYFLSRALETSQINIADLELVSIQVAQHEAAFKNNQVDAVVTFEPAKTKLLNAGANIIFDSSMIPNEIVDVLVVKPECWRKRQQEVKDIVKAWFLALDYLNSTPDDAAKRMSVRLGIKPEEFTKSLEGLIIPDKATNMILLGGESPAIYTNINRLSQLMLDKSLLPSIPETEGMVSSAALP